MNLANDLDPFLFYSFNEKTCGDDGYAHWYVNSLAILSMVCPSAALPPKYLRRDNPIHRQYLFENLYLVSKEEFDTCTFDRKKHPKSRNIMYCDQATNGNYLKYFTLHFKPMSSSSGGLPFPVNNTYYFIGKCNKMLFVICNIFQCACFK